MNLKKNLKVTQAVLTLGIIALLSTFVVASVGFYGMTKSSDNIRTIYEEKLNTIKVYGYINAEMGMIRNSLTKILDRPYSQEEENIIRENDKAIKENLKILEEIKKDAKGEESFKSVKQNYEEYMKGGEEIIAKKKKGETIEQSFVQQYGKVGGDVSQIILSAMDYNKQLAEGLYKKSTEQANFIKSIFVVIFIMLIALVSLVVVVIFRVIKISIKDFNGVLKAVSSGDFTIEMDTTYNNEFGIMKRELACTVKSISQILKTIKEIGNILPLIENVNLEINRINSEKNEIISNVESASAVAEEISASAHEMNASSEEVASSSETLSIVVSATLQEINKFKLS